MRRKRIEEERVRDLPVISKEELVKAKDFLISFFEQLDKDLARYTMTVEYITILDVIPVWSFHDTLFKLIKERALHLSQLSDTEVEAMQRMLFHSKVKLSNKYELRVLAGAFTQLYSLGKRIEGLPKILPD